MIVVAGEALVDMVPVRGRGRSRRSRRSWAAGRTTSPSRCGRLERSRRASCRGSRRTSSATQLIKRLHASNVATDLVQRGPENTTLAVVGLAEDGSARYSFYVDGTADRLVEDPGPLPDDTTAVSFGTLSLVLEPGATRLRDGAAAREQALAHGARPQHPGGPDRRSGRVPGAVPVVAAGCRAAEGVRRGRAVARRGRRRDRDRTDVDFTGACRGRADQRWRWSVSDHRHRPGRRAARARWTSSTRSGRATRCKVPCSRGCTTTTRSAWRRSRALSSE